MAELVRDPVCNMDVDPATAPAQSEYSGTTYYFCSPGCKTDFDADPENVLAPGYVPVNMDEAKPAKRWWEFWK